MKHTIETRHRLNWRGMLLTSEALLYADADTSWILMVPVLIFLYLPSLFLSYLKVNEEGIELLYWPSYRLKSSWDEISHLGNVTLLGKIPFDALYLKKSEQERGVSRHRGIRKKWIIPLGDFRGWPEGELYEQLQIYLPRFFESEKEDQSS